MSTPQNDAVTPNVAALAARVDALTRSVTAELRRFERKRTTILAVGAALFVLCTVGFWTLTNMAFQLDAEALAHIGRHKVESQLPQGRERMQAYLERNAPEITSYAIAALEGCVPSVRPYVLAELDARFAGLTADYEKRLKDMLEEAFASSKAQLEAARPGLSDREKVESFVAAVGAKFNQNVENLYQAIYPDYAAQITQVENYLHGLKDAPADRLTPRERAEKELIQTLLALIAREQQGEAR
jgi:hypothetical protein